jgi:hypothetical protein
VLFVEGPRDRDLLRCWARLLTPRLVRPLVGAALILGGRQPVRAVAHLEGLRERGIAARGLCVLDRDGGPGIEPPDPDSAHLDLFTWSRRHIESYLLVPAAIQRALRGGGPAHALARLLRDELPPPGDERAWRDVDAKRLLDRKGPIAKHVGRPLDPGRIARAMRPDDLHPEVVGLLERIGGELGVAAAPPVVAVRAARPR